jgi:O-antigen ligase
MYERLGRTELEEGMPDTRAKSWLTIAALATEKPLLGHGPRLRLDGDEARSYPGTRALPYPHNLYLFLLYTVGAIGLIAYLWFFAWLIVRFKAGIRQSSGDSLVDGFAKLGILLMIVFLVDQIKVEFLRIGFIDYWHYAFSLFAIFLGFADLASNGQFRVNFAHGIAMTGATGQGGNRRP